MKSNYIRQAIKRLAFKNRLGRMVALVGLVFVLTVVMVSLISYAKSSKSSVREASPKSAAPAKVTGPRNPSKSARRATASRRKKRAKAARKEKDGRKEIEGKENPAERYEALLEQEEYWATRLTYPTGKFDPEWVQEALRQDALIDRALPLGRLISRARLAESPLTLSTSGFTALGPAPERMTGCSGCFDYGTTAGRVNSIAIDPTTVIPGSIVAYAATVNGGVWKSTNCCSTLTSWSPTMDSATVPTQGIDSVVIDPNNHNTIYAGTGDLNFGSFSMGSQGIMKSTDAGATWTVLGANIFGAALPEPVGQFPQYQAVGKVRVDPNDSNKVVAGTKTGLYFSYDAGANWTGPCTTNGFNTQRQDITGLELTNMGGGVTRILAAVGTRGFATPVQYNLDQNGANGLYKGTMPVGGCPADFTLLTRNDNGFIYGTSVTGSPYGTGNQLNAGTGTPYGGNISTGNQLGRMDIAVAPSNPNYIYAQVGSIIANNNSGCGNAAGCQLGVWSSIDGGATWSFMAGSQGGALRQCGSTGTQGATSGAAGAGDYPQNWYDQAIAVDPNNPDRIFIDTYDTWLATRTGTAFYNVTCGYNGSPVANHVVHVDHHVLAFVPGSSSVLLEGSDGGIFSTSNADLAAENTLRPTWVNMDTGLNTIEFYSGDISGFFATSLTPSAAGGAQDNGPSTVLFTGNPSAQQWQLGTSGDGFFARIDPMGTGTSLRYWLGSNSGSLNRCIGVTSGGVSAPCTSPGATWTSKRGNWTTDTQSFVLPFELFHGDVNNPANDCGAAGAGTGCGHLIAGTTRVWETIQGASANTSGTVTWYVNSPDNLTKATLGNRSYINQLAFEPSDQRVVIVGTNDGNVQIGRGLGSGSGPIRAAGTITMSGTGIPLANETFVIGNQTFTWKATRTGTGEVTIGSSTTTSATNIVTAITADIPTVATAVRSGSTVVVTATSTGASGNLITFTEASTNMTMNGSGLLGGTTLGSDGVAVWTNVTGSNEVLPNRPILDVAFDPKTTSAPVAYAAVGGFDQNTPTTPGHVYQVTCTTNCASFTWADKTGNLPNIPADSIIANPNFPQQVFVGTDFGLYYTDDIRVASPVWYRFNAGLPNVMIWDMSIDRGNTTLALFTRGRGAYAWPLPLGPVQPLATSTDGISGSGSYGGTATLSATLTEGGFPLAGKSVDFTLNGNNVGSTTTDASGVATLSGVSLSGINAGNHPGAVGASFAGDSGYLASNNTGALNVTKVTAVITWSNPADITYGTALSGTQLNATANTAGTFVYTPAASTVLPSGNNQNLHVDFTPTDTTNYDGASKDVSINVLSAHLSMTKVAEAAAVDLGRVFSYTVTVSNSGPATATSVVVTDPIAAGLSFNSATATQGSCTYSTATTTVNCQVGTLAANSSATITIKVKGRQEGNFNNTATFSSPEFDPSSGSASASAPVQIVKYADLKVTKVDSIDPIYVGEQTTYTMVVKNFGPVNSTTGTTLTDTLPAGMTFVSATTSQGALVTPPIGSTGIVTANLGSLGVNATATVTVTVQASAAGTPTNTASVSSNETDPVAGNNTASQVTTVYASVVLQKVLLSNQSPVGGCTPYPTGQVYLTTPAGAGGVTVNLSSTNAGATVPASVFIAAGQTKSDPFVVTTVVVPKRQDGNIVASITGSNTVTRSLQVYAGTCSQ